LRDNSAGHAARARDTVRATNGWLSRIGGSPVLSHDPTRPARHLHAVPDEPVPPRFGFVLHAQDDVLTVTPSGELDLDTVPVLEAAMGYQRDLGFGALVVDLRELTFIDSSGVHLLLRWAQGATDSDHDFRVIAGTEHVHDVLAMTGVLEVLGVDG
jgi:anti-sigma B factor antagonist